MAAPELAGEPLETAGAEPFETAGAEEARAAAALRPEPAGAAAPFWLWSGALSLALSRRLRCEMSMQWSDGQWEFGMQLLLSQIPAIMCDAQNGENTINIY